MTDFSAGEANTNVDVNQMTDPDIASPYWDRNSQVDPRDPHCRYPKCECPAGQCQRLDAPFRSAFGGSDYPPTKAIEALAELGRRHPAAADDVDAILAMPRSDAVNEGLLACPFCGLALMERRNRPNPYAQCITEGCFAARGPVINLDSTEAVTAWNTRTVPSPGTRVALKAAQQALNDAMTYGGVSGPIFDQAISKIDLALRWDAGEHQGCGKDSERAFKPSPGTVGVREAFRAADDLDWQHLDQFIPQSGHGQFWRAIFAEVRDALRSPAPADGLEQPPDGFYDDPYHRGYRDGWETAHEPAACGHARANWKDPTFGTPAYKGNESCEVCAALSPSHCTSARRPAAFLAWAREIFGPVALVRGERVLRFIEEAIELAHAEGMERTTLNAVADRVYSRAAGETSKEIGQVQACLEVFAESIGLSSEAEAEREWQRVQGIPKVHWQRRHAAKQSAGIALAEIGPVRSMEFRHGEDDK